MGEKEKGLDLVITTSDEMLMVCIQSNPATISLLSEKTLPARPISIGQYQGCIYATLSNGTVAKVNQNYDIEESYMEFPDLVQCATIYNDKIYMLIWKSLHLGYEVRVYDIINRNEIHRFIHRCLQRGNSLLTAVSDQIVIVDPPSHLTVYSLSGQPVSYLNCLKIDPHRISICPCYDDSIIITEYDSYCVSRIIIKTGKRVWRCRPNCSSFIVGATCFAKEYVLVASSYRNTFIVLDVQTGRYINEIPVAAVGNTYGIVNIFCVKKTIILTNSGFHLDKLFVCQINTTD